MLNAIQLFRDAIFAAGLTPPESVTADGTFRRFSTNDKHSDDAGWYMLHADSFPVGFYGDWRTGLSRVWREPRVRLLSLSERALLNERRAAARIQCNRLIAADQAKAAAKARIIWEIAQPVFTHSYLDEKRIRPLGTRGYRDCLVVPLLDNENRLLNLQFISRDSCGGYQKRFLRGGRVSGCYFAIDSQKHDRIIVCEGFATAASVHQATGNSCVAAMSAGNLTRVALTIRAMFPNAVLVICADNDASTEENRGINPGVNAATAAAKAVNGLLCVPNFKQLQATS